MHTGARFAKWGLGFFVFGLFLTFGIIGHYCVGASANELFRRNVTLWWACPWTLSVAVVQGGGLGMVALGVTLLSTGRKGYDGGPVAFWLCVMGLLGVFAVGYPGYFVFNSIWPNFYYVPDIAGKNAWLLGQAFFLAIYFVGMVLGFNTARRSLGALLASASYARGA